MWTKSLPIFYLAVQIFTVHVVSGLYKGPFKDSSWVLDENSTSDAAPETIDVFIGLKVQNIDVLQSKLFDVSDPRSPNYGVYLTADEVSQISSPDEETVDNVIDWLHNNGGIAMDQIQINNNKDMFMIDDVSITTLEDLFGTELSWHQHIEDHIAKKFLRATVDLYVPPQLEETISFISLNNPILETIKPAPVKPSSDPNSKPYPPPGSLKAWGSGNNVLVRFCFYCWDNSNASPLCSSTQTPVKVNVAVQDVGAGFPAESYSVQWNRAKCTAKSFETGKYDDCDPMDTTVEGCMCGVYIGPVRNYADYKFSAEVSARVDPEDGSSSYEVIYDMGETPQTMQVVDITTPVTLKEMYGIPKDITVKHGSSVATVEIGLSFRNDDLKDLMELSGLPLYSLPKIIGEYPNDEANPANEPSLDVQYIASVAPNATFNYYSVPNCRPYCNDDQSYLQWLFYVGCQSNPELVQSVSYGGQENVDTNSSMAGTIEFYNRVDVEFVKLGLMGVTVVLSSGDNGVCSKVTPLNPVGCTTSVPEWPTSSPWALTTGATQLSDKYVPICGTRWSNLFDLSIQCTGTAEVNCQSDQGCVITSGGGFSFVYDRPWYQEKHVKKYLEAAEKMEGYPTTPGFFNLNGRGYPDVTAYGASYVTMLGGDLTEYCGTSASAPLLSAILTLVNDRLLGEGLPALGFPNPLLYYLYDNRPEVFNDIVVGNNACRAGLRMTSKPLDCSDEYFTARPGWDPIGGLGSFKYEPMVEAVIEIARKAKKARESAAATQEAESIDQENIIISENNDVEEPAVIEPVSYVRSPGIGPKEYSVVNQNTAPKLNDEQKPKSSGDFGSTAFFFPVIFAGVALLVSLRTNYLMKNGNNADASLRRSRRYGAV